MIAKTTLVRRLILAGLLALGASIARAQVKVENLRCEGVDHPSGIDAARPALSWNVVSDQRGQRQTACQALVASSAEKLAMDEGDLWNSGKIASDESVHVPYAGKPLASGTVCFWKVRVWDKDGRPSAWSQPASWTMGLLKPEDWKGQWITASKWFTPPNCRMPGFATLESDRPAAYSWAQVDLGKPTAIDSVKLYGRQRPSFPLRFRIEADDDLDFDRPKAIADCSREDFHLDEAGWVEFPGKGITARRVRDSDPQVAADQAGGEELPKRRAADGGVVGRSERRLDAAHARVRAVLGPRARRLYGGRHAVGQRRQRLPGRRLPHDGGAAPAQGVQARSARETGNALLCRTRHGRRFDQRAQGRRRRARSAVHGLHQTHRLPHARRDAFAGRGGERRRGRAGQRFLQHARAADSDSGTMATAHRDCWRSSNSNSPTAAGKTIATDSTWKWARSEITFNDVWEGYAEDRRLAKPGWDRPGFADSDWRSVARPNRSAGRFAHRRGRRSARWAGSSRSASREPRRSSTF